MAVPARVHRAAPLALSAGALPKAIPPQGCLPAGGGLSCPFEVPDGSFLLLDHCVPCHPLLGPWALQDPWARIPQRGKLVVFIGTSTEAKFFH